MRRILFFHIMRISIFKIRFWKLNWDNTFNSFNTIYYTKYCQRLLPKSWYPQPYFQKFPVAIATHIIHLLFIMVLPSDLSLSMTKNHILTLIDMAINSLFIVIRHGVCQTWLSHAFIILPKRERDTIISKKLYGKQIKGIIYGF